jgi:hypothetical protein
LTAGTGEQIGVLMQQQVQLRILSNFEDAHRGRIARTNFDGKVAGRADIRITLVERADEVRGLNVR